MIVSLWGRHAAPPCGWLVVGGVGAQDFRLDTRSALRGLSLRTPAPHDEHKIPVVACEAGATRGTAPAPGPVGWELGALAPGIQPGVAREVGIEPVEDRLATDGGFPIVSA